MQHSPRHGAHLALVLTFVCMFWRVACGKWWCHISRLALPRREKENLCEQLAPLHRSSNAGHPPNDARHQSDTRRLMCSIGCISFCVRLFTRLLHRTFPRSILRNASVLRHADRPQRTLLALSQAGAESSRPCWPRLTSIQNCLFFAINGIIGACGASTTDFFKSQWLGPNTAVMPFFLAHRLDRKERSADVIDLELNSHHFGENVITDSITRRCEGALSLRRLDVRTVDLFSKSCPEVCHIHHGRTVVSCPSLGPTLFSRVLAVTSEQRYPSSNGCDVVKCPTAPGRAAIPPTVRSHTGLPVSVCSNQPCRLRGLHSSPSHSHAHE